MGAKACRYTSGCGHNNASCKSRYGHENVGRGGRLAVRGVLGCEAEVWCKGPVGVAMYVRAASRFAISNIELQPSIILYLYIYIILYYIILDCIILWVFVARAQKVHWRGCGCLGCDACGCSETRSSQIQDSASS